MKSVSYAVKVMGKFTVFFVLFCFVLFFFWGGGVATESESQTGQKLVATELHSGHKNRTNKES